MSGISCPHLVKLHSAHYVGVSANTNSRRHFSSNNLATCPLPRAIHRHVTLGSLDFNDAVRSCDRPQKVLSWCGWTPLRADVLVTLGGLFATANLSTPTSHLSTILSRFLMFVKTRIRCGVPGAIDAGEASTALETGTQPSNGKKERFIIYVQSKRHVIAQCRSCEILCLTREPYHEPKRAGETVGVSTWNACLVTDILGGATQPLLKWLLSFTRPCQRVRQNSTFLVVRLETIAGRRQLEHSQTRVGEARNPGTTRDAKTGRRCGHFEKSCPHRFHTNQHNHQVHQKTSARQPLPRLGHLLQLLRLTRRGRFQLENFCHPRIYDPQQSHLDLEMHGRLENISATITAMARTSSQDLQPPSPRDTYERTGVPDALGS